MSTRLAGHELRDEGAPYDGRGRKIWQNRWTTSGRGRAKCSCGALSPELPSGTQRKAWHRAHKAEVRAAAEVTR